MAKKFDLKKFLNETNALLESVGIEKEKIKKEIKKRKGCINHPERLIYRKELCEECDAEERNLYNKKNAEKEPWQSTDGRMYIYGEDSKPRLYARYVAEQYLNRPLRKDEKVSFKDENMANCSIENLAILTLVPLTELERS